MKFTYYLMIQSVRVRDLSSLRGNTETRAIQFQMVITAHISPQIWWYHPNGGKMSLIVGSAKETLSAFSPPIFWKKLLHQNQRFVTAGGFNDQFQDKAMFVCKNTNPQSDDALSCNAEEADTCTSIWLHVANSADHKKLVLSPDTEVYHIGLPIVAETDLDVLVRLSTFSSTEHRILDMQALISAFVLMTQNLLISLCLPYHL